ncbi:MAG: CHASE2 domain-containing protein [Solirubrobacteraceae bacterium]
MSVSRSSGRGGKHPAADIVLVTIDDKSFRNLRLTWPFPRRLDGRLLSVIAAEHPRAIAFDVELVASSAFGKRDDVALLDALGADHDRAGRLTIFADNQAGATGQVRFLGSNQGTQLLHRVGSRPATNLFPLDAAGVMRQAVYAVRGLTSLDVATAEVATDQTVSSREFEHGRTPIYYRGPAGTFPSVSYSTVVGYAGQPSGGRLAPDFFTGKIVVVGATAPALGDFHATPDGQMSGAEIIANAIDSILAKLP